MKILVKSVVLFLFWFSPMLLFGQQGKLIPFELEDQFKREYTHKDFIGEIIVLIGSDQGGSEYNGKWGKAINDGLKKDKIKYEINWLGVADVSSAPFFMRGIIRSFFPDDEDDWVLLDWEAEFPDAYDFKDDMSNIIVFDSMGILLYKTAGTDVENEKVLKIINVIKSNYSQ